MKIKDLFVVILKVIGIFFMKQLIEAAITFITPVVFLDKSSAGFYFWSLFYGFLICGLYFLIAYWLIFKPNRIIEKLKLDKGFESNEINLNIHRSVILSIALIVLGGIIILNQIPVLIKLLTVTIQVEDSTEKTSIASCICKLVIGFVLIYYQQTIVNFIELKRKK